MRIMCVSRDDMITVSSASNRGKKPQRVVEGLINFWTIIDNLVQKRHIFTKKYLSSHGVHALHIDFAKS